MLPLRAEARRRARRCRSSSVLGLRQVLTLWQLPSRAAPNQLGWPRHLLTTDSRLLGFKQARILLLEEGVTVITVVEASHRCLQNL